MLSALVRAVFVTCAEEEDIPLEETEEEKAIREELESSKQDVKEEL